MPPEQLQRAIEAVLFAAGEPMTLAEVQKVFARLPEDEAPPPQDIKEAWKGLELRWRDQPPDAGFALVEVAGGLTFRSNPTYAWAVHALKETRPQRLSKAALETLAIVAYRQPATKPEIDHIRGVDCGGTLKLLLERHLVRIVGQKEEPGRPMLYGTSREFLSFFNLKSLQELPSLREFHELNQESMDELQEFDAAHGISLRDLSEGAKKLNLEDAEETGALDRAVSQLDQTEQAAREAFLAEGIKLVEQEDPQPPPEQ